MASKNADKLIKLGKELEKELNYKAFDSIAKQIASNIYRRTKSGKDADYEQFSALSDSYTQARKGYKKGMASFYATKKTKSGDKKVLVEFKAKTVPIVSNPFSIKKSNLTLTGQMLDSLFGYISGNQIIITLKGKLAQKKEEFNAKLGRTFMKIGDRDLGLIRIQIQKEIEKQIREIIRRN